LIYPTRFPKDKRNVELTGEGYFVIAKDAAKPFIVACPGQIVRVTGTRFNISSYSNEQVRTTLLQGKVAIKESSKEEYQPLNPGQQATLAPQGLEISNVNAIDAIGWTNNIFIFSQTPIKDVLTQISRWYNVDVDYTGLPENIRLVGECGKDLMLSEVLNSIHAMSKINFVLEGNKIKIR
jgi:ferric-dicitrate binding protein FerR (iron transport regulator)